MKEINEIYEQKCIIKNDINEHLPVLKEYAEKCSTVIELGVRSIVSTWAFLAAHPEKLISLDIVHPKKYINHDPSGCNLDLVVELAKKNNIEFEFIESDSTKTELPECDMMFFDTLHTYTQLKKELDLHGNKVKKYMLFHDTVLFAKNGEVAGEEGISRAITEFITSNQEWKAEKVLTNNNGLTILKNIKNT